MEWGSVYPAGCWAVSKLSSLEAEPVSPWAQTTLGQSSWGENCAEPSARHCTPASGVYNLVTYPFEDPGVRREDSERNSHPLDVEQTHEGPWARTHLRLSHCAVPELGPLGQG